MINPEIGPSPEIGPMGGQPSIPSPEIPKSVQPEQPIQESVPLNIPKIKPESFKEEWIRYRKNEGIEMALAREELEKAYERHPPPKVDPKYARESISRIVNPGQEQKINQEEVFEAYQEPKDDFEALGFSEEDVESGLSEQQIKEAYKTMARKMHPDKHPGQAEKYEERFKRVRRAYENLMNTPVAKVIQEYPPNEDQNSEEPIWIDDEEELDSPRNSEEPIWIDDEEKTGITEKIKELWKKVWS